jgi:hypothetical protein
MLAAGSALKVAREALGHSTSTLTLDTYTSVYDDSGGRSRRGCGGPRSAHRHSCIYIAYAARAGHFFRTGKTRSERVVCD